MLRTFEDICRGAYLYRDLMEHRMKDASVSGISERQASGAVVGYNEKKNLISEAKPTGEKDNASLGYRSKVYERIEC